MLSIDYFGKKSLQEISEFLAGHGLRFGQELEQTEDGTLFWVLPESNGGNTDTAAGLADEEQ
jgi:hypothetical protein